MKSSSSDTIDVGFVLRAHGVRGVVRVRAKVDLGAVDAVWLGDERFAVRHASRDKDEWLVTLDGVGSREAAEALRGRAVRLPRAAVPVAADELLVADLVGCKVLDVAGTMLGEVTGSFDSGAHEVLEVRAPDGREFMLPLVEPIVTGVDLAARTIVCDPPPGLVNLDEAE
ncbi:MAG TPA: ribosome maturation factor RimM [Polyangia bacterium]